MDVRPPLYMPVLKWKAGEQAALKALGTSARKAILPLIELRSYKNPLSAADCVAKILGCWANQALFDCADPDGILTSWRLVTFDGITAAAIAKTAPLIPVINPDDPVFSAVARSKQLAKCPLGVALRLRVPDISKIGILGLAAKITKAKKSWTVSHVVIDLSTTPSITEAIATSLASELTNLVSDDYQMHLISGCYPNGYKNLAAGLNNISRDDWLLWKNLRKNYQLPAAVGYGDYTVVAPSWEDKSGGGQVPVAYRYADTSEWLIYKGTSAAGTESFALSALLSVHTSFRGATCCATDRTVISRATAGHVTLAVRPGGAKEHISEGVAHHITLVVAEQYP